MKQSYGSIEEFLEELHLDVKTVEWVKIGDRPLSETMLNQILTKTVAVNINGIRGFVNLLSNRTVLYRAMGVSSDAEAYTLLAEAELEASRKEAPLIEDDFRRYFNESSVKLADLAVTLYPGTPSYITSSVFTACSRGVCNASVHRIMVSPDYAAVRLVPRHLHRMLEESGGSIPVAISIGVHPLIILAAASSPAYGVFELYMAPRLLRAPLTVCRTPLYRLPIPCGASYVVEGVLGPQRADEGPFVDILGIPDTVRKEPVLNVKRVYINKEFHPYHYIVVPGSCEHMLLMGFPREASIFLAVSKVTVPVKVRLTPSSGMWLHAIVSIRKRVEGEAVNAGLAALAAHPSLKLVIVVDDDIDPDNPLEVEWAMATRVRWGRDVTVIGGARGSSLDPSSLNALTDKVVIDATAPLEGRERFSRKGTFWSVKTPCT